MDTPRPLYKRVRRALWFLTAGTVILVAVALTLTRLLLPNLESYRTQVEQQASEALGQAVRIKTMRVRLLGLSPTAVLEGVSLLDSKGEQTVARFREVRVGIDLVASLRQRQLITAELTVVGADLTVLRKADGGLRIQGMVQSSGGGEPVAVEGIGRWLLAQQRLALLDSRVHWRDLMRQRELAVEQVEIELNNSAEQRHQLNIQVTLPATMGRVLRLAFDVEGDVLSAGAWSGRGYLEARDLRLAPWQQELGPVAGMQLTQGAIDLEVWGVWQAGRLQQATAVSSMRDLEVQGSGAQLALARLSGAATWQRFNKGWELRIGELQLARRAEDKPESVQAALRRDGDSWLLQLNTLNLADVVALAPLAPLTDEQQAMLRTLKPQGMLRQLLVILPQGRLAHAQAELDQVALSPWRALPGVSALSGRAVWSGDHGQLLLDSRNSVVELPRLFRAPLTLQQLRGSVELHRSDDGWLVLARNMRANNSDIHTAVDAEARIPAQGSPYLSLQGQFWNGRAASAPLYMPAHIMEQSALAWLDNAFREGTVTSGGVVFHGPLARFPFDEDEGRFEVNFRVRDAELFFQPGWPSIQHLDAQVRFLNRSMVIEATRGTMYGSQVQQARVSIDDLHQPLLEVSGAARLSQGDAIRLLSETPLREYFGDYVSQLRLEGENDLALYFALPLTASVRQLHPFSLNGRLAMQGNRLWLHERFSIDAIEGELTFSEQGLHSDGLQVRVLDEPASLSVFSDSSGENRRTVIAGRGQVQLSELQQLAPSPLLQRVSGRSAWQGALIIPHEHGSTRLRLLSDLEGVAVDLPPPFAKGLTELRELEAVYHFSGPQRGQLEAHYGEVVSAALAFGESGALARAALHMGTGEAQLPANEVMRISGSLRELDLDAWSEVLRAEGGGGGPKLPLLVELDALHLKARAAEEGSGSRRETSSRAWQDLPDIKLRVKHFGYGAMQFEQLAFDLQNRPDALLIQNLRLTGPALILHGQARWQLQPRSHSDVKLQLDSPDMGALARHLQLASAITRGKATVNAELLWDGPLPDFEPAVLNGHMHIKIEDGTMEELDPGAGRLLGLLSLQALPRRLLLDFRDLFQKGLAFSKIEGDITLRVGNAYTSNLVMDSTSAQVKVEGRTGLAARDYDQLVTVVPNLSGSAPVVGALAFGPQVGAVMLLFQKMLKGSVDEAAKIQYKVSGPWDAPQIERLGVAKAESEQAGTATY